MDTKILEDIGLTNGEVKVYLALLKLGTTRTGQLARVASVSSSKVYKILDRLEKKGLVGHVIKGNTKYFNALEPKRILDYINNKEEEMKNRKQQIIEILPELEQQLSSAEKSEASIYEGFEGTTNFFRNILDELKTGETYYVIGGGYGEDTPELRRFFHKHHQKRAARKIKVKMLANHDVKGNIEETTKINSEIKYLPQYLITKMEIVFYRNKVFLVFWTKEPKGFLIESSEAVKSFEAYFKALWKIART
ncbi:MAG: helix-turn-helix domain-containing protein [Candidatus Micrarchaeota archaeon]|nr:helix-turn-helix domain-containing protein [Candidatus Micrarchaeota archaeon]